MKNINLLRRLAVIFEQGFISLGNYILIIAFARKMSSVNYGIFSAILGFFLILTAIYNAFILEQITVHINTIEKDNRAKYLWESNILGIATTLVLAFICSIMIAIYSKRFFTYEIAIDTLAFSTICYSSYIRRMMLLLIGEYPFLLQSIVFFFGVLFCFKMMRNVHDLTVSDSFITWGILSGAGAIFGIIYILIEIKFNYKSLLNREYRILPVLIEHWKSSKKLCYSVGISNLSTQIQMIVPPLFGASNNGAELRVFLNFITPFWQLMQSLVTSFIPKFQISKNTDTKLVWFRNLQNERYLLVFIGILYSILIIITGHVLIKLIYSSKYTISNIELILISILPIIIAMNNADLIIIRMKQAYEPLLLGGLIALPLTVACAIFGSIYKSTSTLMLSILISTIISWIFSRHYYRKQIKAIS